MQQRPIQPKITAALRLIILSALALSSACRGQNVAKSSNPQTEHLASGEQVGTLVDKIEGNPNLVFQDHRYNYWLGVGGKGVYKYDPDGRPSLVVYTKEDGLCSEDILGIQEDQSGNMYFDTFEGVSRFDGTRFQTLDIIDKTSSQQDWKLEKGDLWFRMGWNHNGPFRYDGENLYALHFPKPEQADTFNAKYPDAAFNPYGIYSIYQDSKGEIWFGTSSLGVARYNGKSIDWLYEEQLTNTPNGGAFGIRSILEDDEGYFWFNTTRHRYKILSGNSNRNEMNYIQYEQESGVGHTLADGEIDFPYFLSMAEDEAGDLWGVTYQDGVWQKHDDQFIQHSIKEEGIDVSLFHIYKDRQGTLWIVTHHDGLYKNTSEGFEKFNP